MPQAQALEQDTDESTEGNFSNRPVHTIRVGSVQASVWRNRGDNGDFFNTTFDVSYQKDGEWKTGKSYGVMDAVALHKAADMAATYMIEQMTKARGR